VEQSITHEIALLVLQLAFVIFIARIFGEIFEKFLKQPAVLGELIAGVLFWSLLARGLDRLSRDWPIVSAASS
jgi:Kef-type K+ transport system membrane component KefB